MERPIARAGERIAVVSPSGWTHAPELAAGVARLRTHFTVHDDARSGARAGYLAGDDATRAGALLDAVREPTVRALIASRGGFGATRLLEAYAGPLAEALARDPKPLVGFSDVTALHALWARVGVRSLHGPMVAAMGRGDVRDGELAELVAVLAGDAPAPWTGLRVVRAGRAVGRAVGGNLALLVALLGTPHAMPLDGAVLFLEDTGERPFRIDRLLTSLRLSRALERVRAIVLGEFDGCAPGADGVSADDVLAERLADLGVPVVAGAAFGHAGGHRVIPFGDDVSVTADDAGVVRFDVAPR